MFKWLGGLVDSNEKELRRLQSWVDRINALEADFNKLSEAELRAKTGEFRARIAEATAGIRQQLAEAQRELDEGKQCLAGIPAEVKREEASARCQWAQERLDELEKERRKADREALDELLPEAFAAVREAARRTIGQRHYDVQLMGGISLHQGKIAEMKTGEGKTLVATLPLYLNSLSARGCHLATVNDYLARRDPYWMGPVYDALGVRVASIYPMQSPDEYSPARLYDTGYDSGKENDPWRHFRPVTRKEAYEADITYGTSSEFGFDYLRDNMVNDLAQCVQRPLNYAIVDEVDNLLIDEARTPLIISGQAEDTGQLYKAVDDVVSRMKMVIKPHEPATPAEKDEEAALEEQYDYIAYEKERYVKATARGQDRLAGAFRLRGDELFGGESSDDGKQLTLEDVRLRNNIRSIFRNSMTASALYRRDRDYVVKDGEVIIVDEFTGRLMYGRRYAEGLHQAIEAKEHVQVRRESMTYATITIQNYFRMYDKLAGMTGTAATEAEEFFKIYKLEVTQIPTNKPMVREDFPDQIYKTEAAKFRAVVNDIKQLNQEGRPVVIGTVSIEKSVILSDMLKRQGITCQVLNAKEHTREAAIIARAGEPGAVTVATNMAGRGVDIILGGNPEGSSPEEWAEKHNGVVARGGLSIIGTERHEARRIDNQLRGRAGRQGDPGSSRFYISLEDDIVRRFGGDRIKGIMDWAGMGEDTPIENTLVNRAITDVQKRVEGYHFDMRKHLVEYDDVVNKHREVIYGERHKILSGADLKANIISMVSEELRGVVAARITDEHGIGWDVPGLMNEVATVLSVPPSLGADALAEMKPGQIEDEVVSQAEALYEEKEKEIGAANMRVLERLVMLRIIDTLWVEHLTMMEHMRQGIGLQAIAQQDPLVAYKREGHRYFQDLMASIQHDVVHTIYHVKIEKRPAAEPAPSLMAQASGRGDGKQRQKASAGRRVGRNDPCPCGSGKKYKHCCGK